MIAASRSAESSMAPSRPSGRRRPVHVGGAQRGDGRLDAGQRRAQVVGDGGQQRGPHPVALLEPLRLRGLRGELGRGRARRPGGSRTRSAPAGRAGAATGPRSSRTTRSDTSATTSASAGSRRRPVAARGDRPRRRAAGSPRASRRSPAPARAGRSTACSVRSSARLSRLSASASRRARSACTDAPGGGVDDRGDRDRDDQEQHQRDDVVDVGDGQRVQRRGEEVVEQHAAEQGRDDRRPEPADQGAEHGQGEERERLRGRHVVRPRTAPVSSTGPASASSPAGQRRPRPSALGRSGSCAPRA